jgi:hypothetical protein
MFRALAGRRHQDQPTQHEKRGAQDARHHHADDPGGHQQPADVVRQLLDALGGGVINRKGLERLLKCVITSLIRRSRRNPSA